MGALTDDGGVDVDMDMNIGWPWRWAVQRMVES